MSEAKPCGALMAVMVSDRCREAAAVQQALTRHGCVIRLRLGLHETTGDYCANEGLIVLHLCGRPEDYAALAADLTAVEGVRVKTLSLG